MTFPKRHLLGKVAYVASYGAIIPLTVGFGTTAAANPVCGASAQGLSAYAGQRARPWQRAYGVAAGSDAAHRPGPRDDRRHAGSQRCGVLAATDSPQRPSCARALGVRHGPRKRSRGKLVENQQVNFFGFAHIFC